MSKISRSSLFPPFMDKPIDSNGFLVFSWQSFLSLVSDFLAPLGSEKSFTLVNNQASAADISELSFDYEKTSHVIVDYFIQRVTTSTGATELLQAGCFHLVYKPTSDAWSLVAIGTPGPDTSGITLSVTTAGQVQYTSTNITGTASISKITWRARTLMAKHHSYSKVGR